jgi:hypothetical protein
VEPFARNVARNAVLRRQFKPASNSSDKGLRGWANWDNYVIEARARFLHPTIAIDALAAGF